MQETRRARLQAVILEELSLVIRTLKDPRVPMVTLTRVEVTPDGAQATVFLQLLGALSIDSSDEKAAVAARENIRQCLEGLKSASGFLRRHLAGVLTVRHIPSLIFKEDRGLENTHRVHELLRKIGSEGGSSSSSDPSSSSKPDSGQ
jgi:ribosome-binding factor A